MAIKIGQIPITRVHFGTIPVTKVNMGSTLVWSSEPVDDPVLTIVVNGIDNVDGYQVYGNGVLWPDNKKTFPLGTTLVDLIIEVIGYTLDPVSVDTVLMDGDKTLTFEATIARGPLLPGKERFGLPLTVFIEEATDVWVQIEKDVSGLVPTNLRILDDGSVFQQFTGPDLNIRFSDISLSIASADSDDYVAFFGRDATIRWEGSGVSSDGIAAIPHAWYGLQKVGDNIKLVQTMDGITFNDIFDFGERIDYTYINFYQYDNHSITPTVYYPQGEGITTI